MPTGDRPPRILFVEDDESVARSVCRGLERAGLTVTVARSGVAALEELGRQKVDVIVTDQQMPEMSGTELIEKILALDPALAPRIVLTSGDLAADETATTIHATGCRSIAKPYTSAELALLIRAIVARAAPATAKAG
ncbi:MAG: response regulator [Gemmatimonadales bacterium]